MEKLIMLIDIYEEEVVGVHSVGEKITNKEETRIISKKFGFIKWLVENEKIDLDGYPDIDFFNDVNSLLMYLAIQDEPIEFLVSILK